jgi:hypothetical protein
MPPFPEDITTEPYDIDANTLSNLGPLRDLAGIWQGSRGLDVNAESEGPNKQACVERIELQPIDPQTHGPQLLYGLRYHTQIVEPDEAETYHDQVGYWLWEPATSTVIHTLTIPRAQIVMAVGRADADAKQFELVATRDSESLGVGSTPFLEYAVNALEFRIRVTINPNGTWSYEEDKLLVIRGSDQPFHHIDRNTLTRIAAPTPNPLARK